jgi:hypothetical protein
MLQLQTPCLLWEGVRESSGYGQLKAGPNRNKRAHRVIYEALYGPVPTGLDLDHVCHNEDRSCPGGPTCQHRACINPFHLEPVTRRVNFMRGRASPPQINALKTHCVHGHELNEANTYRWRGSRLCRVCNRRNASHYSRRLRARRLAAPR